MRYSLCHPDRKYHAIGKCRPCYVRDYYDTPKWKKKRKVAVRKHARKRGPDWRYNRSLLYKHGITIEDYYRMLRRQDGKCAVCKSSDPKRGRRFFCVDHDHKTGRVRGLLCDDCNLAAGKLMDSADNAMALYEYLVKGPRLIHRG